MLRKFSAALCLLFTITLTVLADNVTFVLDGVTYEVDGTDVTAVHVIACDCSGSVDIPNVITYNGQDYFLSSIRQGAFKDKKDIRCINLPSLNFNLGSECFWGCTVEYLNLGYASQGGINSLQDCKLKYLSLSAKQTDILATLFNTTGLEVETLIIDGIAASAVPANLPKGVKTIKVPSTEAEAYATKYKSVTVVPFNVINVAEGNKDKFCSFVAGEKLDLTGFTDVEAYTADNDAISAMDSKLELTAVTGVVKKKTQLFLLPKKAGKIALPVASSSLQDDSNGGVTNGPKLIGGDMASSRYVKEGEHIWALSAADRMLHPINPGTVLAPGVTYVNVPASLNGLMSAISLEIPGETGIAAPLQTSPKGEDAIHYNLGGVRIGAGAPGLHILSNGRKEIRR